jgi:hypothetical protein
MKFGLLHIVPFADLFMDHSFLAMRVWRREFSPHYAAGSGFSPIDLVSNKNIWLTSAVVRYSCTVYDLPTQIEPRGS